MEALVKEKVLKQFVNTPTTSIVETQPVNVDINTMNVTRMIQIRTMTTNDGNYFIRYGGFPNVRDYYNAIEVYSVNSLDNNKAVYVFDNIKINEYSIYITDLKQSSDGRFYGIALYQDSSNNYNYYLIILNNFIQDGYCKVNKYYSQSDMGLPSTINSFENVAKANDSGIYFTIGHDDNDGVYKLIKFEVNILEGNKTSIATIVDGGQIKSGSYEFQLNVLKDKLIFTRLWETENHEYEYTEKVLDVNNELLTTVTLNRVYYMRVNSNQYVAGATNKPFEAIIPYLNSDGYIVFRRISINRDISLKANYSRSFLSNENICAYLEENYASITDNNNIYLFYYNKNGSLSDLIEFYNSPFSGYYSNTQILRQYNTNTIIGTVAGLSQSIVSIKNIYSSNVTSEPYYNYNFCIPYYMNLYSNSNENTSLIFSRNATERFYSENQLTASFNVPNYLLNDGNIEKASVYGQTNYLMNSQIQDFEKNRFESLYFNFIYNLNVIDNTNGLSVLNKSGSNRLANSLWNRFDKNNTRLSKARITYEDLATEIIDLDISEVAGASATFSFEVTGNVTKIEYLSNDRNTVYATFRNNLTGTNTITQTVSIQ